MKIRIKDRKRFSKFLSVVVSISFVIGIMFYGTGAFANLENPVKEVIVMPGDTLWRIAEEHISDIDTRSGVQKIKSFNKLKTAELHTGDVLLIPLT